MSLDYRLASRAIDLQPFRTLSLLTRAKALIDAGHDIIWLDVGEPDFGTPEPVLQAARAALEAGTGRYTEAVGRPALRGAIASFYKSRYNVDIDPRRVVVTTGSSAALLLIISCLIEAGDEILASAPGYPSHPVFASVANGRVSAVKAKEQGSLWADVGEFEAAWTERTRAILVGSPSNPTGSVIPWHLARSLIDLSLLKGGAYISEELYHGLAFDDEEHTALEHSDEVFVINSFSKFFSMTGWRLGWMVVPERMVSKIEMFAQHLYLSPPDLSQAAALACFLPETLAICEMRRQVLKQRRDTLLPLLVGSGFKIPYPAEAGLFIFADASAFTNDTYTFALELLEHAGVSVAPGIDFGDFTQHLRFSFCTNVDRLQEAVHRIEKFVVSR